MARPPKNGKWQHLNDTGFKQCTTCNVEFPIDEFTIKKGDFYKSNGKPKRQINCKECTARLARESYARNKKKVKARTLIYNQKVLKVRNKTFVQKYKRLFGKCVECGEKDWRVLEFNHINRDKKDHYLKSGISSMCDRYASIEAIKNEIRKCEILCCNCHRKHTWEQLGWNIYH